MTTCGLPFYLKPVVVAAYELLIESDHGFDKKDGMNQLRPCLCWLQVFLCHVWIYTNATTLLLGGV